MNAHQLCAIKALPKSLIRGWLEGMASGVHERNSALAPDMPRPLDQVTPSGDGEVSSMNKTTVSEAVQ